LFFAAKTTCLAKDFEVFGRAMPVFLALAFVMLGRFWEGTGANGDLNMRQRR